MTQAMTLHVLVIQLALGKETNDFQSTNFLIIHSMSKALLADAPA